MLCYDQNARRLVADEYAERLARAAAPRANVRRWKRRQQRLVRVRRWVWNAQPEQ